MMNKEEKNDLQARIVDRRELLLVEAEILPVARLSELSRKPQGLVSTFVSPAKTAKKSR